MQKVLVLIGTIIFLTGCSSTRGENISARSAKPIKSEKSSSLSNEIIKNRLITYTVNITYNSIPEKIEAHLKNLKTKTENYKGYVYKSTSRSMAIKIPAKDYKSFYNEIILLDEIFSKSITATDITDNYYNTQIRLQNALKLKNRLQELLKKANNVKDAIEIERELNRVTESIEIHEATMRRYDSQVQFTTFYIYFEEKSRPGPLGWVFYGLYEGIKWLFIWD